MMCRGNNGQEIFLTDDGRRMFLATLEEAVLRTGWRVHAYCLMSNHYHLLLETPEANLVAGMKWFQGTYTQRFNAMFKRRGHLFQGRYKAIPVQTDPREGGLTYFRMLSTYIHLNPFRARLAGVGCGVTLQSYRWSSYPYYMGRFRKVPDWLERRKVLQTWGIDEADGDASKRYRMNMEKAMRYEVDPSGELHNEFLKQVKRGWFLGSSGFQAKLSKRIKEIAAGGDNLRGAQRRAHGEAEAERLLRVAMKRLGVGLSELKKRKSVDLEKQAIAWLLHTHTSVTVTWIADTLEMGHRVNASRALSRFREGKGRDVKKLKREMLQCTG